MHAYASGYVHLIWLNSVWLFLSQARNDRELGPLALASDYGRTKVVRLLLTANAETERRDYRGNTPLMHASREVRQPHEVCTQPTPPPPPYFFGLLHDQGVNGAIS